MSTRASTEPNAVAAQDLKRRGVAALEERLASGPVDNIEHNLPGAPVLAEDAYRQLIEEAASARLDASLADLREGRARSAAAHEIMNEVAG